MVWHFLIRVIDRFKVTSLEETFSMYRVISLTLCREIRLTSFYIRCLWNVVNHLRVTILLYIIVSSWKLITKLLIVLVSENCLCNSSLPPLVYPPFRVSAWKRWWHELVNQWAKYFYVILISLSHRGTKEM